MRKPHTEIDAAQTSIFAERDFEVNARRSGESTSYTLNRTYMMSPSATTYSFPSTRIRPASFTA